jgi:4-amino-4-deoxy-L-arabinose transferase-like glycosyltransferase
MDGTARAGVSPQPARPSRVPGTMGAGSVVGSVVGSAVPLLIAVAFFVLLAAFAGVDPARGVTASTSPFTDEGWNVLNARNLVLFGRWSTDAWAMHIVNFPFSALQAAWLALAGVGIVPARLLVIAMGAIALAALGTGLRRPLGGSGAAVATAALAGSALFLYYGRLAYLEPLVTLWLILALLALTRERPSLAAGLVAGLAVALAVATKASAAAAGGGMLAGLAVAGWPDPRVRRALAGAVIAALVVALIWLVVFALPQPTVLATDLRIWAPEPLPRSLQQLVARITAYPTRSDGGIPLALPLLLAGAAGLVVVLLRHASLDERQRRVAAACVGWFVAGMAVLLIVPYRPNRYLVPLLPPLAVLTGLGFDVAAGWLARRSRGGVSAPRADAPDGAAGPGRRRADAVSVALAGVLALVLVLPGLALDAGWMTATPSTLPAVQARIAALVPAGAAVQGDLAPVLAMRARAQTIVSRPATDVNAGDLYAGNGVRWVFTTGAAPAWAPLHPAAWAARVRVLCLSWGPGETCLYRLP